MALALKRAGHQIVAVVGRDEARRSRLADMVSAAAAPLVASLPEADLLLLTVRDDALSEVAAELAAHGPPVSAAVHVSGLNTVDVLQPLAGSGLAVGSWHPLQTLPTPELGADRLEGAWMAITTRSPELASLLEQLTLDLGARPFTLSDELKPLYHASASAASNYLTAALGLAEALAFRAGVPFEAARPLVRAVVDNVFQYGAEAALTGPIARGDYTTVAAQLQAIRVHAPHLEEDFRAFGRATARLAGTQDRFEDLL